MIVRRTWPDGSASTFMVSPSTMSSKRITPPTSERIGMLCGSHSHSIWPRVICWPSSTVMMAPSGTSYFSSSRPFGSRIWISPLRDRAIGFPSSLTTMFRPTNLTLPSRFDLTSFSSTARVATPPMWNVRIVSWVPGSPIDWAAMMPTAMPPSTIWPVARSMP